MIRALAGLFCLTTTALAEPALTELSQITLRADIEGFGSYSGLVLDETGERFLVVSDKGRWAEGQLVRKAGALRSARITGHGPILDPKGKPVTRFDIDAEGLTRTPDGRIHVSFEANHRIWSYDAMTGPATATEKHPEYSRLQNNSSLEALFHDASGTLYVIPERSGRLDRPFPVYALGPDGWSTPFTIKRETDFLVAGADLGPDGMLYVLERKFTYLGGFATRIRHFTATGQDPETLLETRFGEIDNMEGIEVWRDADDQIRITLISDDNNSILQSTIFVEYLLTE